MRRRRTGSGQLPHGDHAMTTLLVVHPSNSSMWLSMIFLVSLVVGSWSNLQFVRKQGEALAVYNLGIDTATYHELAITFAQSGNLRHVGPDQPPGFIVGLGVLYRFFGPSTLTAKVVFCVLITLTAAMTYWLGRLH